MIYVAIFIVIAFGFILVLALCKMAAHADEEIGRMMNEEMKKKCGTSTNKEN